MHSATEPAGQPLARTVLITGASRGIGAATALLAARAGWRVAINYHRSDADAQRVEAAVREAGGEALLLRADVARLDEVVAMFARIDAHFGGIDALVNNAGMLASFPITEVDEQVLHAMYAANVYSAYWCTREAVRRMATSRGGRGGRIVNVSSVAARLGGVTGATGYAATKGALESFNTALAKEVAGEGIRVNAVRPGLIETTIHEAQGGLARIRDMARSAVPVGRMGAPEEVAQAIVWLLGDHATYVHGAVLDVSGGR